MILKDKSNRYIVAGVSSLFVVKSFYELYKTNQEPLYITCENMANLCVSSTVLLFSTGILKHKGLIIGLTISSLYYYGSSVNEDIKD